MTKAYSHLSLSAHAHHSVEKSYTLRRAAHPPHRMTIPIPVRLPLDLVAWLDEQAKSQSEPRSTVIRQLLRDQMERQQRAERRRRTASAAR